MIGENINGGHVSLSQVCEIKRFMDRQRKRDRSEISSRRKRAKGSEEWNFSDSKYRLLSNIQCIIPMQASHSESFATRVQQRRLQRAFVVGLFAIEAWMLLRAWRDFLVGKNSEPSNEPSSVIKSDSSADQLLTLNVTDLDESRKHRKWNSIFPLHWN